MSEQQRRRRTQADRRENTERRVLEAAIELISRRGFNGVSLAEVGRLAGYSRGIVNYHFGSRRELLDAVVLATQTVEVMPIDAPGLERLAHFARSYLDGVVSRDRSARAFLVLWGESAAGDPLLEPIFRERDVWFRSFLASLVREGQTDGSITANVDPDGLAAVLVGLLRGTAMQLLSPDNDSIVVIDVAVKTIEQVGRSAPS